MRAYVIVTGLLFALLFFAHVARILAEGTGPLGGPIFVGTTAMGLIMAVWALLLIVRRSGSR